MRTRLAICLPALCAAAAPVSAQGSGEFTSLYVEQLEGVYTQSWYGMSLPHPDGIRLSDVYVVGVGKSGEFSGVIDVDCRDPANSRWRASWGFLSPEDVPAEAIPSIRALACPEG